MNSQDLYSFHVFLFPFQWYRTGKNMQDKTFEEKTRLKPFMDQLEGSQWRRKTFSNNTRLNYNESNYFHDFVRDILYDKGEDPEQGFIANYEYDIPAESWTYKIDVSWSESGRQHIKEYVLHIDSILLHLYNNGVGVISFHLNNRMQDQSAPDDILRINQYGRRLYVPYFGIEPEIVGTPLQYLEGGLTEGLEMTQSTELSRGISIGAEGFHEDFTRYTDAANFKDNNFIIPRFISGLFLSINLTNCKTTNEEGVHLSPLLDDRMFVVCWYGSNEKIDELKGNWEDRGKNEDGDYLYKTNDWWYKFIFVDGGGKTCQNDEMASLLQTERTNARWINYGTLFGVSRYSFVCLSNELSTLRSLNGAFIVNHMQTMYYKVAELALVQRACVLRFSDEVTEISSLKEPNLEKLSSKLNSLYQQYIRFVNKIYFREITPQEQGIELYQLMLKVMDTPKHVEDLDKEIEELHTYVSMREEQERNRSLALLTQLGAIFILPGFIAGFLGMNFLDTGTVYEETSMILKLLLAIMSIPILLFLAHKKFYSKITYKDLIFSILSFLLLALATWLAFYIFT